ncbi:hypothetical protein [Gimesia aquarii]|uniref:Uncharacterized protein n=1 Tax=Gimesia aquarii TaxID=2527964 RepID=A0A517X2E9_9PLAN|nr:hypothetical protein [Gimesia aquarii]QDU11667.1 hypothetical protein V202x_50910 [Gimesia aquarii]
MKHFAKRLLVITLFSTSTTIALGQDATQPKQIEPITVQSKGIILIIPKSRAKLLAYSALTNTWSETKILIEESSIPHVKINPVVSNSLAACKFGQEVHAYSAKSALWAKLKLPHASKSHLTIGDNLVIVYVEEKQISKLYIFGEHSKAWSGVDLTTGEILLNPQQKK